MKIERGGGGWPPPPPRLTSTRPGVKVPWVSQPMLVAAPAGSKRKAPSDNPYLTGLALMKNPLADAKVCQLMQKSEADAKDPPTLTVVPEPPAIGVAEDVPRFNTGIHLQIVEYKQRAKPP